MTPDSYWWLSLVQVSQRPDMAEPAAKQFEKAAQRLGTWQAEEATLERNRIGFPFGDQKRLEWVGCRSNDLETAPLQMNTKA